MGMDKLAHMTRCVAATGHIPPTSWFTTFISACQRSLPGASVAALASLMTHLPALAPPTKRAAPGEGEEAGSGEAEEEQPLAVFLQACVKQVRCIFCTTSRALVRCSIPLGFCL